MASWVEARSGGRVNLDLTVSLLVTGTAPFLSVAARLSDGSSAIVGPDQATAEDAEAFIDDLLLNGS